MTLLVDIGVPVSASVADQVGYIQRAEELGFAGVGLGDNLSSGHDVFFTIAAAASRTDRIMLYPAAVNPVTRHPLVLANLARSMEEHAPGRVKLAIGRGGRDLKLNGLEPASLQDLRDALTVIRRQLREWDAYQAPPLVLAASGPQTLALAGELADEVLLQIGPDAKGWRQALQYVEDGALRTKRNIQDIPVTSYVVVSIEDDREAALRQALPWVQYMVGADTFQLVLQAHGMAKEEVVNELGRLTGGWRGHLADLLMIAGTPDEVALRLQSLAADGVERVCCMVPGGPRTHRRTLEALGKHVVPRLN